MMAMMLRLICQCIQYISLIKEYSEAKTTHSIRKIVNDMLLNLNQNIIYHNAVFYLSFNFTEHHNTLL